jgi:hypothetical protein
MVMLALFRETSHLVLFAKYVIIRGIKSGKVRRAGHVARMGENRNAYTLLVGKPEGERPLGSPRRRWVDNVEIDLREKVGKYGRD